MPVPYYNLDDRSFEDIVSEMLSRIPGHTPEWTNPRIGDPGRTLIDLFAWLADTLLYRANLIPERQRLAFLRLLNVPMRSAVPATGLVTLEIAQETIPVPVPLYTPLKGPVGFETTGEITVLPVQGQVYIKRNPTPDEWKSHQKVIEGLEFAYEEPSGTPYFTTPVFSGGQVKKEGVDFVRDSVDSCLWIALLAAAKDTVPTVRKALGRGNTGANLLNVGLLPRLKIPSFDEEISTPTSARDVWDWEITSPRVNSRGEPIYLSMDVPPGTDTTCGFSKQGVVRLELPDSDDIGLPENDVTRDYKAGVGNRPPRIDDEETASRLVAWIRLRPVHLTHSLALSWAGINAVEIDQRKMMSNTVVATSNGMTDQVIQLPAQSIDPDSLLLQVEEPDQGFATWRLVDDLARTSRDDAVFQLDPEAGIVTFGNGVCGRVPFPAMRIRIAAMRYGGGAQGNLAPGNLNAIAQPNLKIKQPIAASGGADAETLDEAEKRIPAFLKNGDRAVTAEDYKRLALNTPAVELGRVEVLPMFKPQQKRSGIPGVVSVMVIPKAATITPPNPRADRITLERVHSYLDSRRPLAVELYVISVKYVALGLSVAVTVRDGHARDQVLLDVRNALRNYVWPLSPGGNEGNGWPLGQTVSSRELEVIVARVTGVRTVAGVNLFQQKNGIWERVAPDLVTGSSNITLEQWELPELLSIVVIEDEKQVPTNLSGSATGGSGTDDKPVVPIPVVPEVC